MSIWRGKSHVNANHLSRLNEEVGEETIDDSFLGAQLFQVDVISLQFAEIMNYLSTEEFPLEFSEKQKQKLIYKSEPYTLIDGFLFKLGQDGVLPRCIYFSEI